jgi:hypothetical protein
MCCRVVAPVQPSVPAGGCVVTGALLRERPLLLKVVVGPSLFRQSTTAGFASDSHKLDQKLNFTTERSRPTSVR